MASTLDGLTADLGRHRILASDVAAEFWGVSLPHWRRLYRDGRVPKPVRIGIRKLGWRVGDLIDALEARSQEAL
jgi:predicted DNA-binding transcriptional regulator AlpA